MNCSIKSFTDLTNDELFQIYKLRNEVFIVEQNCPYQDVDDLDLKSEHLMLIKDDVLLAYLRIIPPKVVYDNDASFGRLAVKLDFRKQGFGKLVVTECIKFAKQNYKANSIIISAQSYLTEWYYAFGFHSVGSGYLEDGIPHIKMKLTDF